LAEALQWPIGPTRLLLLTPLALPEAVGVVEAPLWTLAHPTLAWWHPGPAMEASEAWSAPLVLVVAHAGDRCSSEAAQDDRDQADRDDRAKRPGAVAPTLRMPLRHRRLVGRQWWLVSRQRRRLLVRHGRLLG
jgi:hypothetical protein